MNGRHKTVSTVVFGIALAFATAVLPASALVKDSDVDGLSDGAETGRYQTDPQAPDTDSDGRSDGDEVLDGTDPLDSESSLIAELASPDPGILGSPEKLAWYIGRASGILAFILLTGVVSFGLVISSRAFIKVVPGATAYETHRFISWLALSTVALHAGSFLFDDFLRMSIFEIIVPFSMSREFTSALGFDIGKTVALGTIALYLMLVLVLTSEFRAKMPHKLWRGIHYVAFPAYILFVLHGFMSGTDSKEWWMQWIYTASVSIVGVLILVRIVFHNILPKWRAFRVARSANDQSANP